MLTARDGPPIARRPFRDLPSTGLRPSDAAGVHVGVLIDAELDLPAAVEVIEVLATRLQAKPGGHGAALARWPPDR